MFPFSFETHQDIEKNLVVVMVVLLFVCLAYVILFVLPSQQRQGLLDFIRERPIPGFASFGGLLAVIVVIAVILVWGLQIQLVYDNSIVGWRAEYETKVILPGLCQPYRGKLDPRFFETAQKNRAFFMKELFYPYVHDRDPKVVDQNKLARFYEQVTKYLDNSAC